MNARPRRDVTEATARTAGAGARLSEVRLHGPWLSVARIIWITLAIGMLVIFAVNLPSFFHFSRTVCTLSDAGDCPTEQLTPAYVQVLDHLHLSVAVAQASLAALCVVVSVLYWLLGLLIFRRKSQEWIGLLVSLMLVMFGATGFLGFNLPTRTPTLFQFLAQLVTHWLMWPAMLVYFFTFPTGRFTPRWTWAAFVPFFVVTMLASLPGSATLRIPGVAILPTTLLPIVVQVYRYVRVYGPVQRQQTKWFIFGLTFVFLLIFVQGVLEALAPSSAGANTWYQFFSGPFWLLPWMLLLLSVSIPILRYRLWDIDVIINRALIYGSLTVILASVYLALVLGAQAALHAVTGERGDAPLIIVASTLLIAALFNPLRKRIQRTIDRRFYRRKYDATKMLAAFGKSLRTQTDLPRLTEYLVAVVEETMRPAHVSLWLRQPRPHETAAQGGS